MPKPDQAPAAEEAAVEPAQDQAADTAAGEEKDYKALYEEALAQSRKWEKRSKDNRAELEGLKQSAPKPSKKSRPIRLPKIRPMKRSESRTPLA